MKARGVFRHLPYIFVFVLIATNVFLLTLFVRIKWTEVSPRDAQSSENLPELAELKGNQKSFPELKSYFQNTARSKGAPYAYQLLKIADIPPNTDLHLLGHVVGDELYKQQGLAGIKYCDQDFRNACSHSIVVGLFSDKGEGALPEIAEACRKAPGGSGAYTMCFHGLGHGILSALAYDLPKAVAVCDKTGTPQKSYREAVECIGGTIMEIVGGGDHDKEIWGEQRKKYITKKDPLAPCSQDFIPQSAKSVCYVYITPNLFEQAGASLANPTEEDFKKAFPFCNNVSTKDQASRSACFGGFGKEFVGLVQSRDIRQSSVNNLNDQQLEKINAWCKLAPSVGVADCLTHALNSLYWGGENDRSIAIRFCNLTTDANLQSGCFKNLIAAVKFYVADSSYRSSFCMEIPPQYLKECSGASE